jgi:hypothetical protein
MGEKEKMKTYKDFDLRLYRNALLEEAKKQGMKLSEKQLERLLHIFIEQSKDDLQTKVSCLTCGKRFPLKQLQHECQEEDIWLYQYIQNSANKKQLKPQYIRKLKEKYPLKKGNYIAFRGINFQTKEEYDSFMKEIENGTYTFKDISSWTLSYEYAKRFARCIQKGTREDDSIRKKELWNMYHEKSNITGYKGVILAIDLKKKMVLCDISEEGIGNMNEHEVILLPGTYPVFVAEVIDKEYGSTEWNKEIIQQAERL